MCLVRMAHGISSITVLLSVHSAVKENFVSSFEIEEEAIHDMTISDQSILTFLLMSAVVKEAPYDISSLTYRIEAAVGF